ncbi:MAG: hypothetical protein WDM81_20410 [Rhizomicrobium sp.]
MRLSPPRRLRAPPSAAGGSGGETPSQPGSTLQMAMTLYAGGVTLGKVDLNTKIIGDQYHSVSNLQTSGVVNAFWQSEIQATSTGTWRPGISIRRSTIPSTPGVPTRSRKCR